MSKKQGLICGGIAGALVIILVVVFCLNPFGSSKKGTTNSDVLASTDGGTTQSGDATIIDDTETPLDAGVGSNDADAPTDEAAEGAVLEGEEEEGEEGEEDEEEVEVVETSLSEATVLFTGSSEQSYEPTDLSWFLTASDDEVITLVYTCTVSANAGWGVLGWGATVNDVWVEGPGFSADASNASAQMYANFTVGELRRALGITAGANVSALKLGAWNGGQIVSLSLSAAGSTPVVSNAIETKLAGAAASLTTDVSGAIVGEETAKGLSGSYIKVFNTAGAMEINIAASCPGYEMGDSVRISATLEGDGTFGGALGTTEGANWSWSQNTFETGEAGTLTCSLDATPTGEIAKIDVWWVGGTAVGVKSISITVTKKGSSSATGDFSGCSQILTTSQHVIISPSSISGFEEGDTVKITATLYSDQYFNGTIGAPQPGKKWVQLPQQVCNDGGTVTWSLTVENMANGEAQLQIWWANSKVGVKSISATVVAKGTGTGGEEGDGTGEGEGGGTGEGEGTGTGGNTGAGGDSQGGGSQGDGSQSGGAGEITPDYAALIAKEGNVLLAEESSCEKWKQAATWQTTNWGSDFDMSTFNSDTYVVVQYEAETTPQLILQEPWTQIEPAYVADGYAVFTYEDMVALYPDPTLAGAWHIGATESTLLVKEVKLVVDGGTGEVGPNYATLIAKEGNVILAEENSCEKWKQAATWQTTNWGSDFDMSTFNSNTYVVVQYEAETTPQLILQEPWTQIEPAYAADGYAVFTYEDMVALYPDPTLAGAWHIGATESTLLVKEVKLVVDGDGGTGEVGPNYAEWVAKEGNVLLAEAKSCDAWGQAATWHFGESTFDVALFNDQTCIVVKYEAEMAPELIVQDPWTKIAPVYVADGYAVFTYEDIVASYPDLTLAGAWHIGAAGSALTVTEVKLVDISDDGGNEDPVQPEKPEYIAKLTKETEYVTDSFSYNFKDYLASYEKGDKVKITVELEGDVYFNGAIGGSDVDAENNFASAQFVSGENNTAVATLIVTTPYKYDDNNGNVVLWWVNPQDGVAYPEVTVKSITLEVVEDEEDPEPAGSIATLTMESNETSSVVLDAKNYAEGLAVGDVIKVAVQLQSDSWFGGDVGYNAPVVGEDGKTTVEWQSVSYANDANYQATVEFTYEIPSPEIGIKIAIYWAGEENSATTVSITSFTVEKVSSGEGGDDEGDSNEEPTNNEEPMKQEEPAGEDPEEDPKEDPKEGPVEDPEEDPEDNSGTEE